MSSRDDLNLVATLQNLHSRLSALEKGFLPSFTSNRIKVFTVYAVDIAPDKRLELDFGGTHYFADKGELLRRLQASYFNER
jgi:hypothetical protein